MAYLRKRKEKKKDLCAISGWHFEWKIETRNEIEEWSIVYAKILKYYMKSTPRVICISYL